MGWYTEGPAELQYKYGDVVTAARASGLGHLTVVPRVLAQTADDIVDTELEFLGLLQRAIEKLELPWQPFEFDRGVDPSGESMTVDLDFDPTELLLDITEQVRAYAPSVIRALEDEAQEPLGIESLIVSLEFSWQLGADQREPLLAWLNQACPTGTTVTEALLRAGRIDRAWYEPAPELVPAFEHWQKHDPSRDLVAHALAWAVIGGAEFRLHQPDDMYQMRAWTGGGEPGCLLFTPAAYPFIDQVAQWLGVPNEIRRRVFYIHAHIDDLELPPEDDIDDAGQLAGHRFIAYLAQALARLPGAYLFGPANEDGEHELTFGWHMNAGEDELSDLFADAGLSLVFLEDILEDEIEVGFRAASPLVRLELLRDAGGSAKDELDYILGDRPEQPAPSSVTPALLLAAITALDLPADVLSRIGDVVRAGEAKAERREAQDD